MTVSDQIIGVLNALCERFGIIVDWTANNVLPYTQDLCKRIVTFTIATDIAIIIFMLISLIIFGCVFKYCLKKYNEASYSDEDGWIVGSIISGIVFSAFVIANIIVIPSYTMDIIKACTIPELTIIEMVEGLIEAKGA